MRKTSAADNKALQFASRVSHNAKNEARMGPIRRPQIEPGCKLCSRAVALILNSRRGIGIAHAVALKDRISCL